MSARATLSPSSAHPLDKSPVSSCHLHADSDRGTRKLKEEVAFRSHHQALRRRLGRISQVYSCQGWKFPAAVCFVNSEHFSVQRDRWLGRARVRARRQVVPDCVPARARRNPGKFEVHICGYVGGVHEQERQALFEAARAVAVRKQLRDVASGASRLRRQHAVAHDALEKQACPKIWPSYYGCFGSGAGRGRHIPREIVVQEPVCRE